MLKVEGIMTAMVTPFKDGGVDLEAMKTMTRRQLDAGVHGLVPLGSTGEAATINFEERAEIIKLVVSEVAGQVPVIVGAGTSATSTTIPLVQQAKDLGADGALVVTPAYVKPTAIGLVGHYTEIVKACDFPLVAYSVPGRTGLNVTPDMAMMLAKIDGVVGMKEASGNMAQVIKSIHKTKGMWSFMSGEDLLLLSTLVAGGDGLICVTSNVAPKMVCDVYNLFKAGKIAEASKASDKLVELMSSMFCSTNPLPVKEACTMLGLCQNETRLPLMPLEDEFLPTVKNALKGVGLL